MLIFSSALLKMISISIGNSHSIFHVNSSHFLILCNVRFLSLFVTIYSSYALQLLSSCPLSIFSFSRFVLLSVFLIFISSLLLSFSFLIRLSSFSTPTIFLELLFVNAILSFETLKLPLCMILSWI